MSEEKVKQISEMLVGLKAYEWARIKIAVEKVFSSASAKIELQDAEKIQNHLDLEFKGFYD